MPSWSVHLAVAKKELDNIIKECIEMIVNKIKESSEKNE